MAGLAMTDEERKRFNEMERQTAEIHAALFKPQLGEDKSLIEKLSALVEVTDTGTRVVSWGFKIVLAVGAFIAAFAAIKAEFYK